jgi:hypothetical protein
MNLRSKSKAKTDINIAIKRTEPLGYEGIISESEEFIQSKLKDQHNKIRFKNRNSSCVEMANFDFDAVESLPSTREAENLYKKFDWKKNSSVSSINNETNVIIERRRKRMKPLSQDVESYLIKQAKYFHDVIDKHELAIE